MKLKRNITLLSLILFVAVLSSDSFSNIANLRYHASEQVTKEKINLLPIPRDFRNYFFLQSIDDSTNIVIGNFVGAEKIFSLIIDSDSDEKVDQIIEYTPDENKIRTPQKPRNSLFTDFNEMKKQIITGEIYKNNYSYNMKSLNILRALLKEGADVTKTRYGYSVRLYDPDQPSVIMSEFFFSKNLRGRYDLVFTTSFYKLFQTKIFPIDSV